MTSLEVVNRAKSIIQITGLCLFTMFALFLLPAKVATNSPSNTDQDIYEIQQNLLLSMRDGGTVSATVVRKKDEVGRLPAVLFYTTYDQGERDLVTGEKAADQGYVGIVAYARGIKTNINSYMPYEHDGNDIYDVIDWISKQSWSNGRVGMYGGSYTGFAQWATAKQVHPALKTIVPQVAVMPGYDTPMENNVCPSVLCLQWPNSRLENRTPQDLYTRWYQAGVAYRSLDTLAGGSNRIFQKWLQHPAYDEYWRSLTPTAKEFSRLNIPILTTTGYYDGAQIGAIQYFKLHHKYNPTAEHYLVIGPYDHPGAQRTPAPVLMGYKVDPTALINIESLVFEWLDYVLKNGRKPAFLKDKINYEVMNGDEWRHASSLDQMADRTLTFYLSDQKTGDNYLLTSKSPTHSTFLQYSVDFKDRQTQNNLFTPQIINNAVGDPNALVFVTQPFTKDFTINGSFSGQLTAAINKRDMDLSIAFYELRPDGTYFFLTRYLGRASYAKDKTLRNLLEPGRKEIIPLGDIRMVSKKISSGSRLVIALNVNKHPFEVINYGSGKNVYDETIADAKEPLKVKWYNDSYIKLPVGK